MMFEDVWGSSWSHAIFMVALAMCILPQPLGYFGLSGSQSSWCHGSVCGMLWTRGPAPADRGQHRGSGNHSGRAKYWSLASQVTEVFLKLTCCWPLNRLNKQSNIDGSQHAANMGGFGWELMNHVNSIPILSMFFSTSIHCSFETRLTELGVLVSFWCICTRLSSGSSTVTLRMTRKRRK